MPDHFTIYEHKNFTGEKHSVTLDNITSGQLYSLKPSNLQDKMSSIQWALSGNREVTFYEHGDGTGRKYTIKGVGSDADTHDNDFKDIASAWRLFGNNSIPLAFYKIPTKAVSLKFTQNGLKLPTGGHLQGIQQFDHEHLILSGSSDKKAFFFIVKWAGGLRSGTVGKVTSLVAINDCFPDMLHNHAGGMQLVDKILVLGAEGGGDANKSSVVFFDLSDLAHPKAVGNRIKRSKDTAGAVGIVKRSSDYLLIVGNWHSESIDFYKSNNLSIGSANCVFTKFKTWEKSNKDTNGWMDGTWGIYEGLNLLQEPNGKIYLVGFNRNGVYEDWADLYSVDLNAIESRIFVKIDKKHLYCADGASFRWGGGLFAPVPDAKIILLAVEENIHEHTTVNCF